MTHCTLSSITGVKLSQTDLPFYLVFYPLFPPRSCFIIRESAVRPVRVKSETQYDGGQPYALVKGMSEGKANRTAALLVCGPTLKELSSVPLNVSFFASPPIILWKVSPLDNNESNE